MSTQFGDVVLKHAVDSSAGGGLFLQKAPLGLQPFVLLLQETHLQWGSEDFNAHLINYHCGS